MDKIKWTHLAQVRFENGKMIVRALQGGYWVVLVSGNEVPRADLMLAKPFPKEPEV